MQPLQPLRVVDVARSVRYSARLAGIGQNDFEPARFKHLVRGNSVDAVGLRYHRPATHCNQPIRHVTGIPSDAAFVRATELGNDGRDCRPRRLVFAARFADHTHGALDESRRGLGCFFMAPISNNGGFYKIQATSHREVSRKHTRPRARFRRQYHQNPVT